MASGQIAIRASVLQRETWKPERIESSEGKQASAEKWMEDELKGGSECLWSGQFHERLHISPPKCVHIIHDWLLRWALIPRTGTGNIGRRFILAPLQLNVSFRMMVTQISHLQRTSAFRPGRQIQERLAALFWGTISKRTKGPLL